MRTKAEALAKPMGQDLWHNRKNVRRLIKGITATWVNVIEWRSVGGYPRPRSIFNESFRRWAENAEFLGGTND